jgi:hypothetical protein
MSLDVEFQISRDDHLAFLLSHFDEHRGMQMRFFRYRAIQAVGWVLCALLLGFYLGWHDVEMVTLAAAIVAGIGWMAYSPLQYKRSLTKLVDKILQDPKNATKLGWRRISLSPECISKATDSGASTRAWQGIQDVVATPDYLFIYESADDAYIIPRSAFADEGSWKQFVDTAMGYYENA